MSDFVFIPLMLSTILGLYVFVCAYRYYSNTDLKIGIYEWSIITGISLLLTINNLLVSPYFIGPVSFILYSMLFYLIFKHKIYKLLHLTIFICLLTVLIDFILSIVASLFVENIFNLNNDMVMLKTIFSIVFAYSFYFIYRLKCLKIMYLKLYNLFRSKKTTIIILYLIFNLILLFSLLYSFNYKQKYIFIIGIAELLVVILICFCYFKEVYFNRILYLKNKHLKESNLLFEGHMEEYHMLKHNLINDIIFIKSICPKDVQEVINEKLNKYISEKDILNDIKLVPEGLQGIIFIKSRIAKIKDINFYVDNSKNINLNFKDKKSWIDISEIIGEVLDNSIEATSKTEAKAVYISVSEESNYKNINIINTFINDINLNQIGEKHYSTRNTGGGLGLFYINSLNKQIVIKNEIINNLFKVTIKIPKKFLEQEK